MCCALFEKAIQTTWWRKNGYVKFCTAGWLNSENPIQIQLKNSLNMYCRRSWGQSTHWKIQTIEQRRGRNGEEEGWGKTFLCPRDQECDINDMTINKYDITWRRHLELKIQIRTLDSVFLASFHVTVFINYVRLNCCIKFYMGTYYSIMN